MDVNASSTDPIKAVSRLEIKNEQMGNAVFVETSTWGKSSISSEIRETVHTRSNTLLADTLTETVMLLHPNETVLAVHVSLTSALQIICAIHQQ